MDISHFFINRPRFAAVLSIAIFLVGLIAINRLPLMNKTRGASLPSPGQYPTPRAEAVATGGPPPRRPRPGASGTPASAP